MTSMDQAGRYMALTPVISRLFSCLILESLDASQCREWKAIVDSRNKSRVPSCHLI